MMVGAGVCKRPEALIPYMQKDLPLGAAVYGSSTPEMRKPNEPEPLFHPAVSELDPDTGFAVNSYGMPNCNHKEGKAKLKELASQEKIDPAKTVVNIAGFSNEDYALGVREFGNASDFCPAAIELNCGCPNSGELPPSYNLETMKKLLQLVASCWSNCPIWVKLSPYLLEEDKARLSEWVDVTHVPTVKPVFMRDMINLIGEFHNTVQAVVVTNTVPSVIYRVNGKPVTGPYDGKAGLSGPLLREISLRQTRVCAELLPNTIDTIGVGGIVNGNHACDFFEAGAKAVQVTTLPFMAGNPKAVVGLLASERLQNYLSTNLSNKE